MGWTSKQEDEIKRAESDAFDIARERGEDWKTWETPSEQIDGQASVRVTMLRPDEDVPDDSATALLKRLESYSSDPKFLLARMAVSYSVVIDKLRAQTAKLDTRLSEKSETNQALNQRINSLVQEIARMKVEAKKSHDLSSGLRKQLEEAKLNVSRLENFTAGLREQISVLERGLFSGNPRKKS